MTKLFKATIVTLVISAFMAITAMAASFSNAWGTDSAGNWHIYDQDGNMIKNAWVCDDAVAENGKNVWYLIDPNGDMVTAGLVIDGTGHYYSLETNHNGYFGMLRYVDGTYEGIPLSLEGSHNGAFAAILNPEAIDALSAVYGLRSITNISNDNVIYTSAFASGTKPDSNNQTEQDNEADQAEWNNNAEQDAEADQDNQGNETEQDNEADQAEWNNNAEQDNQERQFEQRNQERETEQGNRVDQAKKVNTNSTRNIGVERPVSETGYSSFSNLKTSRRELWSKGIKIVSYWTREMGYAEYYIGNGYNTLTFTWAPSESFPTDESKYYYLEVYGDNDNLLWSSSPFTYKTAAQTESINISGNEYIKIVVNGTDSIWLGSTEEILFKNVNIS